MAVSDMGLLATYRMAHREACLHLIFCTECDGAWLCQEGRRLWLLADGLEARLPWRALREAQEAAQAQQATASTEAEKDDGPPCVLVMAVAAIVGGLVFLLIFGGLTWRF